MENILTFSLLRGATVTVFFGEQRVGWIALRDLAAIAAAVLRQGPQRHGGHDYWLSTEVLTGRQVADILSDVLGAKINCKMQSPDVLAKVVAESGAMEKKYAEGAVEFLRQVNDGRMGYVGTVRDDGPFVTGRASTTLRQWATENRESLLRAVSGG
jgi:nucleoside-diphosphate-sugar epimerase